MDEPELLTIGEAAVVLQVSVGTVRRWSKAGHIPTIISPSKQRRFRRGDIERLLHPVEPEAVGQ